MSLSNMKVYNDEIVGTTIELLGQRTAQFNEASGGTLQLSSATWQGDFSKESFFNLIASARRRVNRYAENVDQPPTELVQSEIVGVKVAGGFGPVPFEPSQLTWLDEDPAAAIRAISEGFADALIQDQLNTSVMSAVAAVSGVPSLVHDVSKTDGLTLNALNNSHAKFGDSSQLLVADIMTGAAWHKLVDVALTNSNRLFTSGNVTVVEVLGKRYVVSDIPALYVEGTPNLFKVLSVVSGGVVVDNASDIISNIETANGKTRIQTTWQADYSFGLRMKGYAWDVVNGGKSPVDSSLATSANWDMVVTDKKHTLGTLAIVDADK